MPMVCHPDESAKDTNLVIIILVLNTTRYPYAEQYISEQFRLILTVAC